MNFNNPITAMKTVIGNKYAIFMISAVVFWLLILPNSAIGSSAPVQKIIQVGDSEIIECKDITRTAIGDPVIADVIALSSTELLVNAKTPGRTVLYIWDASGRQVYRILVKPTQIDIDDICEHIMLELDDSRISARGVGNTVILEGSVSREAESSRAEAIAKAVVETMVFQGASSDSKSYDAKAVSHPDEDEGYTVERVLSSKDSSVSVQTGLRTPKVVNLIQIERNLDEIGARTLEITLALRQALNNPNLNIRALPGNVVIVEGKVGTEAELDRINSFISGWGSKDQEVGGVISGGVSIVNVVEIDSSIAHQIMVRAQVVDINRSALKEFGVDWGRVVFQGSDIPGVDAAATVQDQPWIIGQTGFGPFDLFGGGRLLRFDPIGARIRALELQDKAKILSEPNLLVLDGRTASMLVGGEIPVPVVQASGAGIASSISVEYKEFGVRLEILPLITAEDTLQLTVSPEVSSLDFTNAVVFSGFQIPALRSRRAETTVSIRDGQSLIIGGLLQNDVVRLVKKIPVLGDLPVIGELFRSRTFQENESELVIIVTPQIVRPLVATQGN